MVRDRGFEPLTPSVSRKCSTTELTAQPQLKDLSRSSFSWSFCQNWRGGKCTFSNTLASQNPTRSGQESERNPALCFTRAGTEKADSLLKTERQRHRAWLMKIEEGRQ